MMTPMPPLLPIVGCLLALTIGRAVAEEMPPGITTDSPTYCLLLYERVESLRLAAAVAPPPEISELSAEGRQMCDKGLIKGGTMRLRRALTILMHPGEAR